LIHSIPQGRGVSSKQKVATTICIDDRQHPMQPAHKGQALSLAGAALHLHLHQREPDEQGISWLSGNSHHVGGPPGREDGSTRPTRPDKTNRSTGRGTPSLLDATRRSWTRG